MRKKDKDVKGATLVDESREFGDAFKVEGGYDLEYRTDADAAYAVHEFEMGYGSDAPLTGFAAPHTVAKVVVKVGGKDLALTRDEMLALHASLKVAMRLYHAEKAETKTKREEYER